MGIFDSVTEMAKSYSGGGDHAAVAGGLMQELGGVGGVARLIQSMHQNGSGGLVQQWANGQTQTDPNAIEQAIGGSGLIDSIAQRTGMSPDTVRSSLATVLPLVINHLTSNGHVTTDGQVTGTPAPETGSLLQSVLGKLL